MLKQGSKYQYLVNGVRKLEPGEAMISTKDHDFTCTPETFRGVVYQAAATKGLAWRATSVIVGTTVVYAFYQSNDYLRPNLSAYPIVKKLRKETWSW